MFPFEQRSAALELRRKMLADAIRQNQQGYQPLQGQMISGYYVPPSWSQNLAAAIQPGVNQRRVDLQQAALLAEVQALAEADRQAAGQHIAARPQVTPEQQGPVDPSNPAELQARAPTSQDVLAWAQQGMSISSRRAVLERLMLDQEINEPIRAEDRAFRKGEADAVRADRKDARAEALAARLEELRMRAEDRNLDRSSREQLAAESRALQKQLAEMNNQTRRDLLAAQIAAREAAAGAKTKPGRILPAGTVKSLGELEDKASQLESLTSAFKPDYSGPMAAAKNKVSPYVPGMDTDAANWWRDYKKQAEFVERHELFGATLTNNELAAWRAADINDVMKPETIKKNLEKRAALARKVFDSALKRYGTAGYDVEGLGRARLGAEGSWETAPVPVRKFNPATGRLE